MSECRICLLPENQAGPLKDGVCIECERKVNGVEEPVRTVAVRDRALPAIDAGSNPMSLIERATLAGVSPDHLGKLMELQREYNRDRAAERFADALTGFQAEMPPITKSRVATVKYKNSDASFQYKYASFDNIMKAARPYLQRWDIALSFDTTTSQDGKRLEVTVNIRVGTHTEPRKFSLPITPGLMSDAQACGAALSYGKRYALCAALNIVVTDEDNDASMLDFITETEAAEIRRICTKLGKTMSFGNFLKWAGVEPADKARGPQWSDLAQIPNTELARIMDELTRRERQFDAAPPQGTS